MNMAQFRTALSIIVVVAVQSTVGQMMMVSPMMAGMGRPPHQVVRPLFHPASIVSRPEYMIAPAPMRIEPKEPIDEQRLQARIKELEIMRQDIVQKQIELDEKIAALDERAIRCHQQIEEDQVVLRKLEELDRIHSAEQMRLERLILNQRMLQHQERVEQERLARQRAAVEEWNNSQKERQKDDAEAARIEEPDSNHTGDKRTVDSKNSSSKPGDEQASEVQIQKPMTRFQLTQKHDHGVHSTSLQHHGPSDSAGIGSGMSKNTDGVQVKKRSRDMGKSSVGDDSTFTKITSKQNIGRKTADCGVVENNKR